MKKFILVFGIVLLGIGCNNGQKQMEKRATKFVDKVNSACQLTPAQSSKILPIAENFIKARKENKDKYGNNRDSLKKTNMVNRKRLMDTLKTILTPEQFEKLKITFQQQKAKQDEQEQD